MSKPDKKPKKRICKGVSHRGITCDLRGQRRCTQCSQWFCRTHFHDPDWHSCAPDQGTG